MGTYRTRAVARASPDIPVWFMIIDKNFTSASRPYHVDVPSDGAVHHFLEKVIELGWKQFKTLTDADLVAWKLPTPQPAEEVMKKRYLASIKPGEEILGEVVEMEEEMEGKGKGKAKEKAKQEVKAASQLFPGNEISSLDLTEPASLRDIRVLVQVAAGAEGTSCCAVSTRCQLIRLRMSSKHKLQPLNVIVQRRHYHSAIFVNLLPSPPMRH